MKNTINTQDTSNIIYHKNIKEKINTLFDIENNPGIDGVIEVTYGYKVLINKEEGTFIALNESIFGNYISDEDNDFLDSSEHTFEEKKEYLIKKAPILRKKFLENMNNFLSQIENILTQLEQLPETNNSKECVDRRFLINALDYNKNLILMGINSVDFELEKLGIPLPFDIEKTEIKTQINEQYETEAFGGNVLGKPPEVKKAIHFLENTKKSKNFTNILTKNEQQDYNILVNKVKTHVEKTYDKNLLEKHIDQLDNELKEFKQNPSNFSRYLQIFFEKYGDIEFDMEEAKEIFEMVLGLLDLPHSIEINCDITSVYDGPKSLKFPKTMKKINLQLLLVLIKHELEKHYVNQKYYEKETGTILRGAGNVEKEEGLATSADEMIEGYDLALCDNLNHISATVLAGEILTGKEHNRLMYLRLKLAGLNEEEIINRILRINRNYSMNHRGNQHKDLTYLRGKEIIMQAFSDSPIDKINAPENIDNLDDATQLMSGKVGFDFILSGDIKKLMTNPPNFGIAISEIIIFYLISKDDELNADKNYSFQHTDFKRFMKDFYENRIYGGTIPLDFLNIRKSNKKELIQIKNIVEKVYSKIQSTLEKKETKKEEGL